MATRTGATAAEEYCGTTYAARVLGLSVASVQTLVESGQLQAWKTRGGHRRISMRSLQAYLQQHGLQPAGPVGARRLRVLVVEDDPLMRETYRASFARWDLPLDATFMASGVEALLDIATIEPDIVIADLAMPGIDGFQVVRQLSASSHYPNLTIVVVTGMAPEDVQARGGLPAPVICRFKPLDLRWLEGFLAGYRRGRAPVVAAAAARASA